MVEIIFRAVIEVLGKPKEHVEQSLQGYIEKLKNDKDYTLIDEKFAELKKQDEQELWATFAEVEIKTDKFENLTKFCFEFMPSLVEVLEPHSITFAGNELSEFLSDLQARLHNIDMLAKQVKMERDHYQQSMGALLKNYIHVLLSKGPLTGDQLSRLTGIKEDRLGDFLDALIDEGKML